jgi:hypothetical protein
MSNFVKIYQKILFSIFYFTQHLTKKESIYLKNISKDIYIRIKFNPNNIDNYVFDLILIQANSEDEAIKEQGNLAKFWIGNFCRVRNEDKDAEEEIIDVHKKCLHYLINMSENKNIEQIDNFLLEYAKMETTYFRQKYNKYVRVFLNLNEYFK